MAVLVTRPGQQGQTLCQQLNDGGINSLHQPLIQFSSGRELASLPTKIGQFDVIIAVSQHAVSFSSQTLISSNQDWPECQYVAVGQKTAQDLSKVCGQKVHYPETSDSEHLLQLPLLNKVKGKKVLILRGNGGRELIFDTLCQRGARVEYLETYKRENIRFNSRFLVPIWKTKGIKQLIITSSGQLVYFVSQVAEEFHNWLFQLQLYVPSKRIAEEARDIGFTSIVNTEGASNKDLLAALKPNKQDD
ncbi:uroporphyrinogen-III synthase [Vibrio sp. TRT 21S02]|uniref:uroporphyrinogen-III synthase n=1 Tax=Vibrio sp. TRT 21S02 TaxID=3418507 RepID=UPI003CEF3992